MRRWDRYTLVETPDATDAWVFKPGQSVLCEERAQEDGAKVLIAVAVACEVVRE